MTTVETRPGREPMTAAGAGATSTECGLTIATMIGAAGGAVAGTALGAGLDSAFPVVCGTLGTMLGGVLLAGGWCLFDRTVTAVSGWSAARRHQDRSHEAVGNSFHGAECG